MKKLLKEAYSQASENTTNLSDYVVYSILREDIIKQRLLPAQRLFEPELANRFEVSRTPVRSALQRLASEGLVEIIPRKGAVVKVLSKKEISDLFQIRAALEKMAVENVCGNEDLVLELNNLIEQSAKIIERNDVPAYAYFDQEFHYKIAEETGNVELLELVKSLHQRVYMYRLRLLAIPGQMQSSLNQHKLITDFISAGQPQEAGKAAERHVDDTLNMLNDMFFLRV
ncbi:GntR family transcriptional regulator [Paradesulfitobacterium aromaticivorans]